MRKLKLAVVGCGAQADFAHLPAIARCERVEVVALVDKVITRAQQIADKYRVSAVMSDYREVVGKADAALITLPNYLHAPVAVDLLRQGVHVLVEKPMALSSKECEEMIKAADYGKATLAVGLDFRFPRVSQWTYQVLRDGLLGDILSFDLRLGNNFSVYFFESDYLLRKETAGGGVLIDLAVHALDLILWWLGDYDSLDYYDDAMGGVESNSELQLKLKSGACGIIEASRFHKLRNTCIIHGKRGALEIGLWDTLGLLRLKIKDQPIVLNGEGDGLKESWSQIFQRQLDDFATAVLDHCEPFIPGREGKRSVELIEACYASRKPLPQPWMSLPSPISVSGKIR